MQNLRLIATLVLFLRTLAQIATDIYLPSFPAIKSELFTTDTNVQLTFSLFLGGFAFSQLIYGPLSDRFGRKPLLLVGVSIYFIMSIFSTITHSISLLLIARTIQGLGAGSCSVIPRAIMRDCYTGKTLEKMAIYQSMIWSIVPIMAPLLGSYIQHLSTLQYGWSIFFVAISFILGTLINRFLLENYSSSFIEKQGLVIISIAVILLLFVGFFQQFNLITFLIPIFILQIGCALVFPSMRLKQWKYFLILLENQPLFLDVVSFWAQHSVA